MILAAGPGRRLRSAIAGIPKGMVPLGGKPVLEHAVIWLRKYGVTDLIINLHHLPRIIADHFGDGARWGVQITYSFERELLGTAGGVKHAGWFFDGPFFVWYGDHISTCRLDRLWEHHRAKGGVATIALHYRQDPTPSGIVELDTHHRVRRFLEKPKPDEIFTHWVNAGIFVLQPRVLGVIPAGRVVDFGRDTFPTLLAKGRPLYGYYMSDEERLWWIDRPEDLRYAESYWGESP